MKHGKRTQWSLSNISLKYRLPLLIGTLLARIIVACNWASYRAVKASALDVGRERLQNLTQQLPRCCSSRRITFRRRLDGQRTTQPFARS